MAAERTFWGQFLGSGRGGTVCLAMKVLLKKLEKLSGHPWDNAKKDFDLGGYVMCQRFGGPAHRGGTVCLAMKVLLKNLEKLSGQAGGNVSERLELSDFGAY